MFDFNVGINADVINEGFKRWMISNTINIDFIFSTLLRRADNELYLHVMAEFPVHDSRSFNGINRIIDLQQMFLRDINRI